MPLCVLFLGVNAAQEYEEREAAAQRQKEALSQVTVIEGRPANFPPLSMDVLRAVPLAQHHAEGCPGPLKPCFHLNMNVCTCVRTYVCVYVRVYVCLCVCPCVCMSVCTYVCVHVKAARARARMYWPAAHVCARVRSPRPSAAPCALCTICGGTRASASSSTLWAALRPSTGTAPVSPRPRSGPRSIHPTFP